MSNANKKPAVKRDRSEDLSRIIRFGMYATTFTADEMRHLEIETDASSEVNLLRIEALRLARLTPLKKFKEDQLDALIKLIRVVAMLDVMQRTGLMQQKVDGSADVASRALAAMDPDDI